MDLYNFIHLIPSKKSLQNRPKPCLHPAFLRLPRELRAARQPRVLPQPHRRAEAACREGGQRGGAEGGPGRGATLQALRQLLLTLLLLGLDTLRNHCTAAVISGEICVKYVYMTYPSIYLSIYLPIYLKHTYRLNSVEWYSGDI